LSRKCFICGTANSNRKGAIGKYSLLECPKCGLQFIDPVPDSDRLSAIYSDYYKAWGIDDSPEIVSVMKKGTFSGYLEKIRNHVRSGRLLDVGCATGEFMQVAQEKGFDVYGAEISPYGIKRCQELFGKDKIITSSLSKDHFPPDYFDVITLADVIEHLSEPAVFWDIIYNVLKPNGILMIVTPDTSSLFKKLMGMRWLHYKEEHIYYYSRFNIALPLSGWFEVVALNSAYKTLNLKYCLDVLRSYSKNVVTRSIIQVFDHLPNRVILYPFKINIGELFVIFRKVTV